jgi:hypothetical protein
MTSRPAQGPTRTATPRRPKQPATGDFLARLRRRKTLLLALGIPLFLGAIVMAYLWSTYAAQIDARLNGEQRSIPRIFGRRFELKPGSGLTPQQLEERLNDVGYALRETIQGPGEFTVVDTVIRLHPRADNSAIMRVEFSKGATPTVARIIDEATNKPARHADA